MTIQTTRRRRAFGSPILIAAALCLSAIASGPGQSVTAAPSGTLDSTGRVEGAASALVPAKRLAIDASRPIFPMQTEPFCYILDNFGDPRGTRVHQGTDIMADTKVGPTQAVYAVVDGVLGRQVIDGDAGSELSGNSWRLTAANSTTWYGYMHLSSFAPGLANGTSVRQGDIIGYVGDTGNPGPGNYHLHFEVHPNGGNAINALTVLTVPPECTVQS